LEFVTNAWAIDSQVGVGYRRDVVQTVLMWHETEAELVDQGRRVKDAFGGVEKAGVTGVSNGKFRAVALMRWRACCQGIPGGRPLQTEEAFGIRKKESSSDFVPCRREIPGPSWT